MHFRRDKKKRRAVSRCEKRHSQRRDTRKGYTKNAQTKIRTTTHDICLHKSYRLAHTYRCVILPLLNNTQKRKNAYCTIYYCHNHANTNYYYDDDYYYYVLRVCSCSCNNTLSAEVVRVLHEREKRERERKM